MARTAEYRIVRWDYQLTLLRRRGILSPGQKGEAVERILGAEITTAVPTTSGKQISIRGTLGNDGSESSECDLIFRDDWSGGKRGGIVDGDDAICVVEVKTDLKRSEIVGENGINQKISELRQHTNAPILLVGIRHDHTPNDLRGASDADETVAFGALKDRGSAEKMANPGEFDRLADAVEQAVRSFEAKR